MSDAPLLTIQVRCFASVRELLGTDALSVQLPVGSTVEALKRHLTERAADLARLPVAFAVNQDYATGDTVLKDGDEVAFIPPISGGSGRTDVYRFEFTHEKLDAQALELEVRSDRDGAVLTFAGVTRNHNDGAAVQSLRYECYEEMARKVMGQIFEAALNRFDISRARVVHRLGEVPVGEASVLVVVAAEHRGPAFEACRYLMDQLKAEVPIFKQELLSDANGGESRWVGKLPGQG